MLPDVAADVLHFLSRRDLDKACGLSKWLDAMIAKCCEQYPLRPVHRVALSRREASTLNVGINADGQSITDRSFSSLEEAARFTGTILRHSFVKYFQVTCSHS